MRDLKNTALKIVVDDLGASTNGHLIFRDAVMKWAAFLARNLTSDMSYKDTFTARSAPEKAEPKIVYLATLVFYQGETQAQHILNWLSHEWCYRMETYFDATGGERVEKFQSVPRELSSTEMESAVDKIVNFMVTVSVDEALDFMAILAVEWARRCTTQDFDIGKLGYVGDDGLARYILWGFEVDFQVWL